MKIYGEVEMCKENESGNEAVMSLAARAKLWESMGVAGIYVKNASDCIYESAWYLNALKELTKAVGIPLIVEAGGGSANDIESILALGVESVVLGDEAVEDEILLEKAFSNGKGKISVFLDLLDGAISSKNWVNVRGFSAYNFVGKLAEKGCRSIIYSDKNTKSSMNSRYDLVEKLCSIGRVKITLSGWLSSEEELLRLKNTGIDGFVMNSPDILRSYNY